METERFMKIIKVATHNKHFHPDDVFAVATLSLVIKNPFEIERTRDPLTIKGADYVVDVGGEYDEEKNHFDHHQKGGAGVRENGIPYASFGLVWNKYGNAICGSEEVARMIERKIVEPTDAEDSGVAIIKSLFEGIYPYSYFDAISSLNPTWKEKDKDGDELFRKAVEWAKEILLREIEIANHFIEGRQFIEKAYNEAEDKKLIILDREYSWKDLLGKFKDPLFVVAPNFEEGTWRIIAVRDDSHSFVNRKNLPANWGGKQGEELAKDSGVADANFCHRDLFIAEARSKEGAIKMAKIAIESL